MLRLATKTVHLGTHKLRLHQLREMFREEVRLEDVSEHVRWAMRIQPIFLGVRQRALCSISGLGTLNFVYELSHVHGTISNLRM